MNNSEKVSKLEHTAIVIFGVTGDLTKRKLIPAIYELYKAGRIPKNLYLIGFARRSWTDDFLKEVFAEAVKTYSDEEFNEKSVNELFSNTTYVESTFENQIGYEKN